MNYVEVARRGAAVVDRPDQRRGRYTLPISKLHQVPYRARLALKVHRITTCDQLLTAAGNASARAALASAAQLEPELLDLLVRRADMARVHGVGVVFGLMLEELGVTDVASIAASDPIELHERLRRYNGEERRARRSPTPEEVAAWVAEARSLPILVT
jgi:predicted flap endonuclease-1-like 5' DNA nuclease